MAAISVKPCFAELLLRGAARPDVSRFFTALRASLSDLREEVRPIGVGAMGQEATSVVPDLQELMALAINESNFAVYVADAKATLLYVNRTFTELLGYEPEEVIGRRARDVLGSVHYSDKDYAELWDKLQRGIAAQEEVRTYDRWGREVWLTLVLRPVIVDGGTISYLVGTLENTTESRQIQSLQREILEAVAQNAALASVMSTICERVETIFPEVICSILSVDHQQLLHPLASPSLPDDYNNAIDGLPSGPCAGSCGTAAWRREPVMVEDIETDPLWADFKALALPLGLRACWSSPIMLKDGRVAGTFAFYFRERRGPSSWHEQVVRACVQLCVLAFDRDQSSASIAKLAYYDSLTGLPNRAKLRDEMMRRVDRGDASEQALLFLDIDHFKDVNDTLGHGIGDAFLVQIADRLRAAVWPEDVISRHGGDEFVILLAGANRERAGMVARKLLRSIAQSVEVEGVRLPASASIGISLCPGDGTDSATLLRNADTAMYQAKSEGRNTYRFFSSDMNRNAQDRLLIGTILRDAVALNQISLHYQPQVDAQSSAITGVEALARWTHPALGIVPPGRFIPLAEDLGLIAEIGGFALREAMEQLRRWDDAGIAVPRMAVNVSPLQFREANLPDLVAATLETTGIAPHRLIIEITEGVVMDSSPLALANVRRIRGMGVGIAMDDFGTGYSSLSHLARLPVSELKIDRGFMADLETSEAVRALVTAVVRIGQSLKLTLVAEGVETAAQQRILAGLGCDVLQGYLFARPMAPEAFADWMHERSAPSSVRGAA